MGAAASTAAAQARELRSTVAYTPRYEKAGGRSLDAGAWPGLAHKLRCRSARLRRWDGHSGSPEELRLALAAHLREFTDPACGGFRRYGCTDGIEYEIHDGLTAAAASGDAYFRLRGTLRLPAALFVALLMAPEKMGAVDRTVHQMHFFHDFGAPPGREGRSFLCYWLAQPPSVLLAPRDGVDLSAWWRDDDGALWQGAVTVTEADGAGMPTHPSAVRAADMYFGYRLVECELDGAPAVEATLVCQTAVRGWLPVGLKNRAVCAVLADYMRSLESLGIELVASGAAGKFVGGHAGLAL